MNISQKNYAVKRVKEVYIQSLEALVERYNFKMIETYNSYQLKISNIFTAKLQKGKFFINPCIEMVENNSKPMNDFNNSDITTKRQMVANGKYNYMLQAMREGRKTLALETIPSTSLKDILPGFKATVEAMNKEFVQVIKDMITNLEAIKLNIKALCDQTVDTIMLGDDASQVINVINNFERQVSEFIQQ